jgi:hypothetical protein
MTVLVMGTHVYDMFTTHRATVGALPHNAHAAPRLAAGTNHCLRSHLWQAFLTGAHFLQPPFN